jgi:mycoredoxin
LVCHACTTPLHNDYSINKLHFIEGLAKQHIVSIGLAAYELLYNMHMDNLYSLNPTKIVMYSTQYCPDCTRAKAFFEAHNIPYERVLLEGNQEATEFVLRMNNGYRSVPTIVFPDGSVLVEPSWKELAEKTTK